MAQEVSDLCDFKLIITSSKREFKDNNLMKDQLSVDSITDTYIQSLNYYRMRQS